MKPQFYSIVILLLTRINYAQETSTQNATVSGTELPTVPTDNTTSVAEPPVTSVTNAPNVTSVSNAPDDHTTSAPETTEDDVTFVTKAPQGNTTSVSKTSGETMVSEIPTGKATVLSEAPNSQVPPAPSLAPNASPVRTTKGSTMTTRNGGTETATSSTSVSIRNQTSNPIVVGHATTQQINKVTKPVRKTTRLTTTKSTPGNGTSAFPVPSLFAVMLLVVSVLCF